jgi:uridine kinase
MITIIRDVNSSRQDFVFFVDRLATLLVEKALEVLPHSSKTVVTPLDVEYHGQQSDALVSGIDGFCDSSHKCCILQCICGVTIQRS